MVQCLTKTQVLDMRHCATKPLGTSRAGEVRFIPGHDEKVPRHHPAAFDPTGGVTTMQALSYNPTCVDENDQERLPWLTQRWKR
jgi:hypothetical protein